MADPVGQLEQRAGRHDPLGRIGAERASCVGDAIADCEFGDVGPDRDDHAGRFDPHAVRQWNRIIAKPEIGVGEVEADGGVPDADLAGPRIANLDVFVAKDLGTARFVKANRLCHQCYPAD